MARGDIAGRHTGIPTAAKPESNTSDGAKSERDREKENKITADQMSVDRRLNLSTSDD